MPVTDDPKFNKLMDAFTDLMIGYLARKMADETPRAALLGEAPKDTATSKVLGAADLPTREPILYAMGLGVQAFGQMFYDLGGLEALRAARDDFLDRAKHSTLPQETIVTALEQNWGRYLRGARG